MDDKQFHLGPSVPAMSASQTPSSAGDVDAAGPTSLPESAEPLSRRPDAHDDMAHSHTEVRHEHPDPFLHPSHLAHESAEMPTIQPYALTATNLEENTPGSIRLGPGEFAVTLPMDSRIKDDYERVLMKANPTIRDFLATFNVPSDDPDHERASLQSKVQDIISRLNNVSTHPDLNTSPHMASVIPEFEKEASWAEYSSTKFFFLGHLIDIASTRDLHLVIAAQNERKQNIVERYLLGKGFAYTRPREEMGGAVEVSLVKDNLSFGVHSTDSVRDLYKAPSAILVLDSTFNPKAPSVEYIRTTYTRNGGLLPVIWLLISNACEHIQRCLPDTSEPEQLRFLLHYTARLHHDVGDLQDDALGIHESAEEILSYLVDPLVVAWPLPMIEPLHGGFDMEDSTPPSSEESHLAAPKRSLPEDDEDDPTAKRARLQTQGSLRSPKKFTPRSLPEGLDPNQLMQLRSAAAEAEKLKAQMQAMEKALGILQHRYETRTSVLHQIRRERDNLIESKASNEQRVEKFKEDNAKLKADRARLETELSQAREEIKHGGGTLAQLEAAREEIRQVEANRAEYTREQYQTASTVAAQSGNEARQLRDENEDLKRRVATNLAELKKVNNNAALAMHTARIEELELILASRDDLLRRKEEEIRDLRRNRPSTRSTSTQPRSPKWGANSRPTSPGINNGNGNGMVASRAEGVHCVLAQMFKTLL
ncbi:hypothetical protein N7468_008264 [Penicillium chermesinum]|uniref:HDA1 complex subunit n=1 Tax=Penicillium chermesinum TaxID=63820 RepID=A0A9W9NPG1_9EURO|nr:uncharacterized protein N7468_008264 [Penicillium chermesinum]KAJ5223722.1 hypothetical protein N7468_008264 [Penicillium chermesinum]